MAMTIRTVAVLALVTAASAGCDEKAAPAPPPSARASAAETATPPPKPTLPPTLAVDTSGALVAGTRVSLDGSGAPERLKTELAQHREFIEGKEVRAAADRPVKPAYVATLVDALGALGATRVLMRTSTRAEFPAELGFIS